MTDRAVYRCPQCGAPADPLAGRTCQWCHSVVEFSLADLAQSEAAAGAVGKFSKRSFEQQARGWTLRPGGTAIPWEEGPNQPGSAIRPALDALRAGLAQPGFAEIAADPDLDLEFCIVVGQAMDRTHPGAICGVIDALTVCPGTDPAWAAQARRASKRLSKKIGKQGMAADPTPPRLNSWATAKLAAHPPR